MSDFQWIIDNSSEMNIDNKKMVAQSTARDGIVRSVSRGSMPWKFTVKVADGIPWTTLRNNIAKAEKLNRDTVSTIQLNNTGHDWLIGYQGSNTLPDTFTATWTKGSNIISILGGASQGSGYKFKAGDIIQLNSGKVYEVASDVLYNSSSITLHRPVLDNSGSGALIIGQNVTWSVKCTKFPNWNLFARNQVAWDGVFEFVEDIS